MLRRQAARPAKGHEFRPAGGPHSSKDGSQGKTKATVGGCPMSRQVTAAINKTRSGTDNEAVIRHPLRHPVKIYGNVCHIGTYKSRQPVISIPEPGNRLAVCRTICLGRTARPRDSGANEQVYSGDRGYCTRCQRFVAIPTCHCCGRRARRRSRSRNSKCEVPRI